MDEKERLVLAQVIKSPQLFSLIQTSKGLFKSEKSRLIFNALETLISGDSSHIDEYLLAEASGLKVEEIISVSDGVHRIPEENFTEHLRRLEQRNFAEELFKESEKQKTFYLKGMEPDFNSILKITEKIKQTSAGKIQAERLAIQKMSEVEAKPVTWLWQDRFPRGMLSLLVGDAGTGKSYLAVYIASIVSKGECFPDSPEAVPVIDTLYLSSEDPAEYTFKPRLMANGADCERVFRISGILTAKDEFKYLDVEKHLPLIEKEIENNPKIGLIIIDPVVGYLGKNTDANDTVAVRISLELLASLAERRNITIIGIAHMNKNQAADSLYRIAGSHQFMAVPRAVWLLAKDKSDESIPQRRLLSSFKMNIGFEASGLRILAEKIPELGVYRLHVDSEKIENLTAADVLNQENQEQTRERKKITKAVKFLVEKLGSGEFVNSTFLEEEAEKSGIKYATLRIAYAELGVLRKKSGFGKGGFWLCYLSKKGEQP